MLLTALSVLAQAMAAPTTYTNPVLGGVPPTPGGRSCYGCIGGSLRMLRRMASAVPLPRGELSLLLRLIVISNTKAVMKVGR